MPKIPEISVGIQMERSVSVSSDRNSRDHLWRWSTYFGRNIPTEILTNWFFALIREFERETNSGKSHSYWLDRFNRKMSFHFARKFPLISNRSVWHNGKHPSLSSSFFRETLVDHTLVNCLPQNCVCILKWVCFVNTAVFHV